MSKPYEVWLREKKIVLDVISDGSLAGDERALSGAFSNVVHSGYGLSTFLEDINTELAKNNSGVNISIGDYRLWDSNSTLSKYRTSVTLMQGDTANIEMATVDLRVNGSCLISSALRSVAEMPDYGSPQFLIWSFETDLSSHRGKIGYEKFVANAVDACNKQLAAASSQVRVSAELTELTAQEPSECSFSYEVGVTVFRITADMQIVYRQQLPLCIK